MTYYEGRPVYVPLAPVFMSPAGHQLMEQVKKLRDVQKAGTYPIIRGEAIKDYTLFWG